MHGWIEQMFHSASWQSSDLLDGDLGPGRALSSPQSLPLSRISQLSQHFHDEKLPQSRREGRV